MIHGIAEISSLWMYWNQCVKRLRICPNSVECQYMAARAQAQLVIAQVIYFGELRP